MKKKIFWLESFGEDILSWINYRGYTYIQE